MLYPRKHIHLLAVLLIVLGLLLSACGAEEAPDENVENQSEAAPTAETVAEQPADNPEPAPEDSVEATKPPADEPSSIGSVTSDLGFRPEVNGFSFENYGGDANATNLTSAEVERMFGPDVCSLKKDGECVLVPAGQQWMEEINAMMAGGHCEGFAALSLLMYADQIKPAEFSGPTTNQLSFDNQKLQREIAYWWATQATEPTTSRLVKGTPSEILKYLLELGKNPETYTIGIYKRDGSGGHAITPFAVQDDGGGVYSVLVYDNNYPNTTRKLQIDSNKDTWSYEASINPSVESEIYEGDASTQTLDLTPTSARVPVQVCPFCAQSTSSNTSGLAQPAQKYNQIFLEGMGNLLIEDAQGNQMGYVNGKMVNTIPGAQVLTWRMQNSTGEAPEPAYMIPSGVNVKITVDGSALKEETLTDLVMIGPGFSIGVEAIGLTPGQKDTVEFMPDDETIVYDTDSTESPTFVVGIEQPGGTDYEFVVQGADMNDGGTITVVLDTKNGDLFVNTEKLTNEGNFTFDMTRYTDVEEETFTAEDIAMKAGSVVWVNYAEWKGNGTSIIFAVDTNGDDIIDDEYEVVDSQ